MLQQIEQRVMEIEQKLEELSKLINSSESLC
jgi:hypothetical protein